jgi:dTMP kinase
MAYLFACDRHNHLYNKFNGVYALMNNYKSHVICPRYIFSSIAYNCHTPEQRTFVEQLNAKFPNPDLVIYIDLASDIAIKRIRDRGSQEIYETQAKLAQVRSNYQEIFHHYDFPLIVVDGNDTPENIHNAIVQKLGDIFND